MRVRLLAPVGLIAVGCGGGAFSSGASNDGGAGGGADARGAMGPAEASAPSDGPTSDGGSSESDSRVVDATGAADAPTGIAVDAADAANTDAACPSFCHAQTPAPAFCSDFDSEQAPVDWTSTLATNGGTVTLTQALDTSCPNALSVSLPQVTVAPTGGTQARVATNIVAAGVRHVVVQLEAYLPSNDAQTYVTFFGVRPTAEPMTGAYVTHHGDPYWFVSNAAFNTNIAVTVAPLTGAWNPMTLDVTFAASGAGKVIFTYQGSDNASHVVTGTGTTAAAAVASVTLEVGMQSSTTTEASFAAYYDDIVLTIEP